MTFHARQRRRSRQDDAPSRYRFRLPAVVLSLGPVSPSRYRYPCNWAAQRLEPVGRFTARSARFEFGARRS